MGKRLRKIRNYLIGAAPVIAGVTVGALTLNPVIGSAITLGGSAVMEAAAMGGLSYSAGCVVTSAYADKKATKAVAEGVMPEEKYPVERNLVKSAHCGDDSTFLKTLGTGGFYSGKLLNDVDKAYEETNY